MTSGSGSFSRNRLYPRAPKPNEDISVVRGNCSDEHKQLCLNTLAFFAGHGDSSVFGYDAAKYLKLVEMNLNRRPVSGLSTNTDGGDAEVLEGQTICEIEVQKGDE